MSSTGSTGHMPAADDVAATARAGAESVYRYVARTAERVPDGVRWRTLSYDNQPQYDLSVFNGVAGISAFLATYYRLTGDDQALDLALGAARWCARPERLREGSVEEWRQDGLFRGRAGVGMAWLRLAEVTGDRTLLQPALEIAAHLQAKGPGPVTDVLDGAAGEGIYFVRLAEATGQEAALAGAVRTGEWLAATAIRDERGTYWPWEVGSQEYGQWYGLSFAPGLAGIGYFLLLLSALTQEARWAGLAQEVGETLTRYARPDHGGLNWPDTLDERELRCQWCNGAPGVGLFFVKAYDVLGDPAYLRTAEAAGEATYQYGDVRRNPVQCHGLAGQGELLLDLYRSSHDGRWLERAHHFAQLALAYRTVTPEGDVWQADDPGYSSPDFMCGASGTGHFFLRLWQPDRISRPFL
jgi:lantibiotic modifying enzyme